MHDCDVVKILIVVIVVSNVKAWGPFRKVPDVVVDLPIRSLAQLHADATYRDVVVNLVVRSTVIQIEPPPRLFIEEIVANDHRFHGVDEGLPDIEAAIRSVGSVRLA